MSEVRTAIAFAILLSCGGAYAWAENLPDPTRPYNGAGSGAPAKSSFEVTAIFIAADRRLAVINGKTVGVDDIIDGARVSEILPGAVRLSYRGKVRTEQLLKTSWRREP